MNEPENPSGGVAAADQDALEVIEGLRREIAASGISVSKVLRRADLAESTWHRWTKNGLLPRDTSIQRVRTALQTLLDESRTAA